MPEEELIQELVERLRSDSDLLEMFRENPAEIVERFGIDLTDEQRDKLEGEDWSGVSDDEVVERLNEGGTAAWL